MPVGHEIRDVINKHGTADDIRKAGMKAGMRTLRFNASRLVIE